MESKVNFRTPIETPAEDTAIRATDDICCREKKDEGEWEEERQSFSMARGGTIRHKSSAEKRILGDIEMVDNAMWTPRQEAEGREKEDEDEEAGVAKKSKRGKKALAPESSDDATEKYEVYTDEASGAKYTYNTITRSTRWLHT